MVKMILLFLCMSMLSVSANDECQCQNYGNRVDDVFSAMSIKIFCCASKEDFSGGTITWKHNGQTLNEKDYDFNCDKQILYITKVKSSHQGNYTCFFPTSSGTTKSISTFLNVVGTSLVTDMVSDVEVRDQRAYAEVGEEANMTCIAYVGKISPKDLTVDWTYFPAGGGFSFLPADVDRIGPRIQGDGIMIAGIEMKSVTQNHFGTYSCSVSNSHGFPKSANGTLVEGKSPQEMRLILMRMIIVVVITIVVIILLMALCLWRWRLSLRVWYMTKRSKAVYPDVFKYDVYIVHGEDDSEWVEQVLLKALEDDYGYLCYVPSRDMLAGEQLSVVTMETMPKCRCVLFVISPHLLESQWASWAVDAGITTHLNTETRTFGIILKELGTDSMPTGIDSAPTGIGSMPSETKGLLGTLKILKSINIPRSCAHWRHDHVTQAAWKESDKETCDHLARRVLWICSGNPEVMFWQNVRLCLELPMVRPDNNRVVYSSLGQS